jgi:hypothetical protein
MPCPDRPEFPAVESCRRSPQPTPTAVYQLFYSDIIKVCNTERMQMANKVMREPTEHCFAIHVPDAGRIRCRVTGQTFRTHSETSNRSAVFKWGIFPRLRDKVRADAGIVHRMLTDA